jgi:hypothetical protein
LFFLNKKGFRINLVLSSALAADFHRTDTRFKIGMKPCHACKKSSMLSTVCRF